MRELYQQTFSQVHSSTVIRWEDMEAMKPKKRISKNLIMLAAVIALLAVLSTVAVAVDLFGLRSLLLPQKQEVTMPVDPETGKQEVQTVDFISLSGYQNLPEGLATAEWQSFLNGYDVTGAAQAADKNPGQMDEKYALYQVYNQEMAGKLDEIVEKYDLKLHTAFIDVYEHPEAMEGIWEALGDNRAYSAYMYEDGTFQFDGEYDLPDYGTVDYQFRRAVRGTFNEVVLNVGDISQYKEWTYKTACGQMVTLALSPSKALVLADLGDSFVTVNVLAGTETALDDIFSSGPFSAENLEALADSFDFKLLTPAVPPKAEAAVPEPDWTSPAEDMFYASTAIQEEVAQNFYCEFVRAIEEDRREDVAELIAWPRLVTVPDGTFTIETAEDFLPYYDDIFSEELLNTIHENQYDKSRADLFTSSGMVGDGGGTIWFALIEDGCIKVLTVQNPEGWSVRYDGPTGVQKDIEYPDCSGTYIDRQGTSDAYSELELRLQKNGSYMVSMGLYRLTTLEGTAVYQNGELYFTCDAPNVEGKIVIDGDTAEVTITKSEWDLIQTGEIYRFPDGKE